MIFTRTKAYSTWWVGEWKLKIGLSLASRQDPVLLTGPEGRVGDIFTEIELLSEVGLEISYFHRCSTNRAPLLAHYGSRI